MNFLPLVLGFLLLKNFNLFGTKDNKSSGEGNNATRQQNANGFELDGLLDRVEDAQNTLNLVSTFNKMRKNEMNMTEVLGEIMNNPVALNLVSKLGLGANNTQNNEANSDFDKDFSHLNPKEKDLKKDEQQSQPQNTTPPTCDDKSKEAQNYESSANQFEAKNTMTDTLFKPIEKIAGVEVIDQLKKYYENWYVK